MPDITTATARIQARYDHLCHGTVMASGRWRSARKRNRRIVLPERMGPHRVTQRRHRVKVESRAAKREREMR